MADLISQIEREITGLKLKSQKQNIGVVTEVGDGVCRIDGLSDVQYSEIVDFGWSLVGRVVDGLGNPIDGKGPVKTKTTYPVEKIAPGVITRQSVNTPL